MKIFLIFLISFTLHSSILTAQKDTTTIIILHTNDMHGYINSYSKMRVIIDKIKQKHKNTIFVSAGDIFSGNPYVDKYIKPGYPMVDLMNMFDYKVTALGNHEFDYGQKILKERISELKCEIICSNINTNNSILNPFKPYSIQKVGNTKIAFISGLKITDKGIPQTLPINLKGLTFTDPINEIKKNKYLKDSADIVIGLTHLGYKSDIYLAKNTNYIDIIIGGHSHTIIDSVLNVNNTMICQAGSYSTFLGVLTLKLVNKEIVFQKDSLYNTDYFHKEDEGLKKLINDYRNNKDVNKVIGHLNKTTIGKAQISDFFTAAFNKATKADMSFMNYGGIRKDTLKKGKIIAYDIYSLDPFNNDLVIAELSAKEIKSMIKYSYNLRRKEAIGGSVKYKIITKSNGEFKKVVFNKPLDKKAKYKIVVNSYMAKSYKFKGSEKFKSTGIKSNEALMEFILSQH